MLGWVCACGTWVCLFFIRERRDGGGGWANLYCEIKNLNSIYIFQCTVYGVIIQTKPTTWTFFIYIHLLSFGQTPLHGPFLFTYIYYIIQTKLHHIDLFYLHTFIISFRQTPPHGPFLFTYIYYYIIRTNLTTWTFFYLHTFITSFRQTPPHGPFLFIISFTNYAITNISKLFFDTHKMAFFLLSYPAIHICVFEFRSLRSVNVSLNLKYAFLV